eukprot:6195560-Pleurochrysis_carterae.AAC.2
MFTPCPFRPCRATRRQTLNPTQVCGGEQFAERLQRLDLTCFRVRRRRPQVESLDLPLEDFVAALARADPDELPIAPVRSPAA